MILILNIKDKISEESLVHVVQVPTFETTITDNTIIHNIDITKLVTYHSNSLSQVSQITKKYYMKKVKYENL